MAAQQERGDEARNNKSLPNPKHLYECVKTITSLLMLSVVECDQVLIFCFVLRFVTRSSGVFLCSLCCFDNR